MDNKVIEQWLKINPKLKEMSEYTLFTTPDEVNGFIHGECVEVDDQKISIKFINKILNNYQYYDFICRYFNDEIHSFNVSSIITGELGPVVSYKKVDIIKAIEKLVDSKKYVLNAEQTRKVEELKQMISFEKFMQRCNGASRNVTIDDNTYLIKLNDILWFLTVKEEEFEKICSNDIKFVSGLYKEYLAYATCDFIEKQNIFDQYIIPENIIKRYEELKSCEKIDIQSVNKYLKTSDTRFEQVELGNKFLRTIIENVPRTNQLEQAIYIYIKLCKFLEYDEQYKSTRNPGYIEELTKENNKVVSNEFNLIYSKILNKLNINFRNDYFNSNQARHDQGQLDFRCGKFLASVDFDKDTLISDMINSKQNEIISGITCKNKNKETLKEFERAVSNVYNYIVNMEEQEKRKNYIDSNASVYYVNQKNVKPASISEKLTNLMNKVRQSGVSGKDALLQLTQLKSMFFTPAELSSNISIYLVRDNNINSEKKGYMSAIITLNSYDMNKYPDYSAYYVFEENLKYYPASKEQVIALLDTTELVQDINLHTQGFKK